MIHVEKDQEVLEHPNLRVASPSGDYDDYDLIECYDLNNPGLANCSFQAQYIKYGGLVYKFNELEELAAELIKLDPDSSHQAVAFYKEDQNRKLARLGIVENKEVLEPEVITPVSETPITPSPLPVEPVVPVVPEVIPEAPITPTEEVTPNELIPVDKPTPSIDYQAEVNSIEERKSLYKYLPKK